MKIKELKAYVAKMVDLLNSDDEHHFENCCKIEATIREHTHLPEVARIVERMDNPDDDNYFIIAAIDDILGIYWDTRCRWCENELNDNGECLTCDRGVKENEKN